MGSGYSREEMNAAAARAASCAKKEAEELAARERKKYEEYMNGSDDENDALPAKYKNLAVARSKWGRGAVLGKGAFSEVYAGIYDTEKGSIPVAIKTVPMQLFENVNDQNLGVFLNELDVVKKITQEKQSSVGVASVVGIFGLSIHRSRFKHTLSGSLIMELGKCTLESFLGYEKKVQMTAEQKYLFALDIAQGLSAVHKSGVLHRDLKDSNIILVEISPGQLKAKVADFGVSHAKQTMTAQTTRHASNKKNEDKVGTELWQAPELIRFGFPHSFSSDIYSFGLICWRILSGGERLFVNNEKIKEVVKQERLSADINKLRRLYEENYKLNKPTMCDEKEDHLLQGLWEVIERCLIQTHREDKGDWNMSESEGEEKEIEGAVRPTADELVAILTEHLEKIRGNKSAASENASSATSCASSSFT
jgi:serine/threonine protein kinase